MGALAFAILIGLAVSTTQKSIQSDDVSAQLVELLKNTDPDLLQGIHQALEKGLESPPKHHKKHRKGKNLNLMNIKNVNVVIKNNNLRRKPGSTDQGQTQAEADNQEQQVALTEICKLTGRCGNDLENGQELGQFLNKLQDDLKYDQRSLDGVRCGCNRIDNGQDQNGQGDLRCGCHKESDRINGGDDDDKPDHDRRDKDYDVALSENFNNLIRTIAAATDEKTNNLPFHTESNTVDNNEEEDVNPGDFYRFYENWKARVLNKLMAYVDQPDNVNNIDISKLTASQQRKLMNIRENASKFKLNSGDMSDELKEKIRKLVFAGESDVVVLPHSENNDNVYVPLWVYNAVKSDKLSSYRKAAALRKQKLLPLTKQQKIKLAGLIKKKTPSISKGKSHHWRRSLSDNLQNFGVPFELEVQGLGQAVA